MYDFTNSLKILIHVSRIVFPKYPWYYFTCFMLLKYIKIHLERKNFKIVSYPDAFIKSLLSEIAVEGAVDVSNCAFVNSSRFASGFAKLYNFKNSESKPRFVQIFTVNSNQIKNDEIILSDALNFNLKIVNKLSKSVTIKFVDFSEAPLASEVDISRVNSFCDIQSDIIDTILKEYFATPRLLYKNDIIFISVKEYAREHYFMNRQVNSVKTIYFKCNTVVTDKEKSKSDGCFVCVADHSALKLSANVQSFIPKITKYAVGINKDAIIDTCPYGLTDYFVNLRASIRPFLSKNGLNLNPLFLIQGSNGCGKNVLVSSVAASFGLHLYKVSSVDVAATSYSQVESKLRSLLFKIKLVSPCVLVLDNFENFGKNHEGLYDQRIMHNLQSELKTLFKSNNFPIIVICISNKKEIHSDLKRIFLKIFDIDAPTVTQREQMLLWLLNQKNLNIRGDLNAIASKCHGFYYEDVEALVFHALKMNFTEGFDSFINEECFYKALDLMQSNYSKSMGAPKVPKVEWSDIGGLDDIKTEIIKTVQLPLKHPEYFTVSGLKRSGILLYGPPGTGKTLIAKAVATECNLCFLSVKGPELLNMYIGQSEENIRNVFQRAREAAPCIIFFDELDSLAPNRGISGDSGGVMDRVVSQLLAEMDGLNKSATVIIIGATNRPDLLDPALLRPGRFDKLLYVGPCATKESKVSVLHALTKKFKLASDINLQEIVDLCPVNITGADYYGLCADAWMSAVRKLIKTTDDNRNTKLFAISAETSKMEDVVVSRDDFLNSIRNLKPSLKPEDLRYFENLQNQFKANS